MVESIQSPKIAKAKKNLLMRKKLQKVLNKSSLSALTKEDQVEKTDIGKKTENSKQNLKPDSQKKRKEENSREDVADNQKRIRHSQSVTPPSISSKSTSKPKIPTKLPSVSSKSTSLLDKKMKKRHDKLAGAQFRWLNEKLYTTLSSEAQSLFTEKPQLFHLYHEGFRHQVHSWPVHPLDLIISDIQKVVNEQSKSQKKDSSSKSKPRPYQVADLGCGEARLAATLKAQFPESILKVHSFDLVAANEHVIACDIANVPLKNNQVDVVVFCLALMGTNWLDFIREANRILCVGGKLKIAEVESRILKVDEFIKAVTSVGFELVVQDLSHKMFSLFEFVKKEDCATESKGNVSYELKPCVYKKRG